jgi:hypothetical protein
MEEGIGAGLDTWTRSSVRRPNGQRQRRHHPTRRSPLYDPRLPNMKLSLLQQSLNNPHDIPSTALVAAITYTLAVLTDG